MIYNSFLFTRMANALYHMTILFKCEYFNYFYFIYFFKNLLAYFIIMVILIFCFQTFTNKLDHCNSFKINFKL